MAYLINKSDGSVLTTVSDGQIDNLTTDLTLIGKNYSGFGEAFNENLIKLLENFSGVTKPTKPIRGQIWFDVTELKLKVYNGTAFQPVISATISATQPTTLTPGDLWFDDTNKQLYFYDGINTLLLGPSYGIDQGLSGIKVTTILDTLNQSKVITNLYNNGTLIGIFSSAASEFTP
jgi:arginine/lysine/ornithine decarboxylase